jgi:predicted ATPase/DNA-binding SARP family transcriptional activator
MPRVDYFMLGPLTVRPSEADQPPIRLTGQSLLLLGRLLMHPGRTLPWETLSRAIWDENEELRDPRNAVQRAVGRLREQLGDGPGTVVATDGSGYRLVAAPLAVDAERFRLLVDHGHRVMARRPRAARAMLEEALASWRGPLLGEYADLPWVAPAARELEALRDAAEVDLNAVALMLEDYRALASALERQLAERPTDQRRLMQRVLMLEALGLPADATDAYREAVRAVGEPSAELRAVGDRLARGVPPPRRSPATLGTDRDHGPRPDAMLLYAILDPGQVPDGPGLGTAVLIIDELDGEPHPLASDCVVAVFASAEAAADAAVQLADDPWLRCRVGLHLGGTVGFGDRLIGPGPPRCRQLATAAHPGQILVSAAARDRHWSGGVLRDLGVQRHQDLLPGESVYELRTGARGADFPLPETLNRRPHNLPVVPSRFIGRAVELERLSEGIAGGVLLTLTGVGGAGKTRLALQLAAPRIGAFADGAWFASLAELPTHADVEAVATAIVAQLGARIVPGESAATTLTRHLAERRMLLVVDNCEHVLAPCRELLAAVRAGAPQTCLVATSRRPLRITGEWVVDVPAMSLSVDDAAPDQLPDAVELLLERAGSLPGAGAGDVGLVATATRVCVALEGLPLAIELAAGQIPARGLEGVAAAIEAIMKGDRGLGFLASDDPGMPPRQRTIEATIRWSYDLLDEEQRAVLRRLAVFRGSFGMAEAQLVARGDGLTPAAAADVVESLVECSMVAAHPPLQGQARLRLRHPIRSFALDALGRSGELERVRAAHVEAYRALAGKTAPTLFGRGEHAGLERLEADHDNLRAALEALVAQRRAAEAIALVNALWWLWFSHGHFEEGAGWVRTVLALDPTPARARVRALRAGSHLTWWRGDYAETDRYNKELAACAATIDDAWGLAWAPMGHGAVLMSRDPQGSLPLFEDSRDRYLALGRRWEAAYAMQMIGAAHWYAGDEARARPAYAAANEILEELEHGSVLASVRRGAGLMAARCGERERGTELCNKALAFSERIGDRSGSAQALNFLAEIARDVGTLDLGAERHAAALQYAREVGDLWATCSALDGIATIARVAGRALLAARLYACSDRLAARAGYQRPARDEALRRADDELLRASLAPGELERATTGGETMDIAEAATSALVFARDFAQVGYAPV